MAIKRLADVYSTPPRVVLALPITIAYGRDLALGVSAYTRTHGRWRFLKGLAANSLPLEYTATCDGDGIIAFVTEDGLLPEVIRRGTPVVNISGRLPELPRHSVVPDDAMIGEMAAAHFIERGTVHFAYVGVSSFGFSIRRGDTFLQAVRQSALARHAARYEISYVKGWDHEVQQSQLSRWVDSLPKPVAIFACNDFLAANVADACRRCGAVVPEDVAILGVDNDVAMCEFCDPSLSSIDPNIQQIGYHAAAMLDTLMRGRQPDQPIIRVAPRGVVVRHSSDALAIGDVEIASAVRFIRDNIHRPIGVEQLLEQVPMNRRMLERRFRRALGRTPAAEIRRCRIELAKKLLIESDRSMSEIARACGFLYPQHLAAAFRQLTGQTPTDYRQRCVVRRPDSEMMTLSPGMTPEVSADAVTTG